MYIIAELFLKNMFLVLRFLMCVDIKSAFF